MRIWVFNSRLCGPMNRIKLMSEYMVGGRMIQSYLFWTPLWRHLTDTVFSIKR